MTYSFGSISFGSLVVSIISFIRQVSAVGKVAAAEEGDTFMYLIFCCFNCIAQIVEVLVRWFNHYAYTQIALYGKVIMVYDMLALTLIEVLAGGERYVAYS